MQHLAWKKQYGKMLNQFMPPELKLDEQNLFLNRKSRSSEG